MGKYYEFETVWRLNSPVDSVWAEFEDSTSWPQWWKGVQSIDELEPGNDIGVGKIVRSRWKSLLPYELVFDAEIVRVEHQSLIEAKAFGELEGLGTWRFDADTHGHTRVQYDWRVKTTQFWMNLFAPIAKPFFHWNHNVIMGWGGTGLANRLGCSLIENTRTLKNVSRG